MAMESVAQDGYVIKEYAEKVISDAEKSAMARWIN